MHSDYGSIGFGIFLKMVGPACITYFTIWIQKDGDVQTVC